jgi:hypothetical protein
MYHVSSVACLCFSVQLIVSLVSVECFICFMYMFQLILEARVHGSHANECGDSPNTLATFRMSLGTMFIKVISPNYASKY